MGRRPGRRGFSLLELIISIGIIGTSLILVVGIFTVLVSGSQKASDLTSGSVVADGLLSQTIYQVLAVPDRRNDFFRPLYATPTVFRGGTYQLNSTVYFYKIYCTDVTALRGLRWAPTDIYGLGGSETYLKRFDVVVWWNDAAAGAQTSAQSLSRSQLGQAKGMGMQEVHQMRLVWPNGSY